MSVALVSQVVGWRPGHPSWPHVGTPPSLILTICEVSEHINLYHNCLRGSGLPRWHSPCLLPFACLGLKCVSWSVFVGLWFLFLLNVVYRKRLFFYNLEFSGWVYVIQKWFMWFTFKHDETDYDYELRTDYIVIYNLLRLSTPASVTFIPIFCFPLYIFCMFTHFRP